MVTIVEFANSTGLHIACTGDLDLKELCHEMQDLPDRFPALPSWYFVVGDLSTIGQLNVYAADFDLLVEQHRRLSQLTRPNLHVAVIAKSDLAFGVSRMWQAASEPTGWDICIFRERRPAEAWLRHNLLTAHALELPPLWPEESAASA